MTTRRHRRVPARRSRAEWIVRGAMALTATFLCYFGLSASLADVIKKTDPGRAHRLSPGNGRITAALAEEMWATTRTGSPRAPSALLAVAALRNDATTVGAASTLGFQAQLRGDMGAARRWLAYAQMLSRRHLPAQLWAIEDAVGHGDIPGALHHYDIALRTSKNAPDLLFPVLLSASADPAIRVGLARTIAGKPAWAPQFIDFAAINATDYQTTAMLFAALRRGGVPISAGATALVVTRLVERGAVPDAWRYYRSVWPKVDPMRSRDPQFAATPDMPSLFDWTPVVDPVIATSIQRGERGGVFDFSVPTGTGGVLLRQLQVLPSGSYRLTGHSMDVDQPDRSRPYWTLTCLDGREIGRVELPNSRQANGNFDGRLAVPADCPAQMLSFVARPSDAVGGVAGQLDRTELTPQAGAERSGK